MFLFIVLMISREGIETSLLLLQLKETLHLAGGAVLGLAAAAGVAWLWSRFESSTRMGCDSTFSWSSGASSRMWPTRNERSRSM